MPNNSYRMSKLSFGSSNNKILFDIHIDSNDFIEEINSICHIEGSGFLIPLTNKHNIAMVDYNGKLNLKWLGLNEMGEDDGSDPSLSYPSSICYSPLSRSCYLVENGGTGLRHIEMGSKYTSTGLSRLGKAKHMEYFSKAKNYSAFRTFCDIDNKNNVYCIVKELHRCFKFHLDQAISKNFIGAGRSGFSVSTNYSESLLNNPCGIKCINDDIYIADSGNHCIRKYSSNNILVVAGNPLKCGDVDGHGLDCQLDSPSNMTHSGGIIYFLDNNKIKYFSLSDNNVGTVYNSKNKIVAIESNKKREIFVLEKL